MNKQDHRLSRPDLAAQMVHDILKQQVDSARQVKAVKAQIARAGGDKRRKATRRVAWLLPLFLGVSGWNLWRSQQPAAVLTDAELSASRRLNVYLAVEAVHEYRRGYGTLPPTLEAAGVLGRGLDYHVMDSGGAGIGGGAFTLSDTTGLAPVTYRTGGDLAPLTASYTALRRGHGPRGRRP
jgi:hypothetical protein